MPALATDKNLDYAAFRAIPVQHEGRIKPLASYARIMLHEFADAEKIDGMPPEAWLAEILFDPAAATTHKTFRIDDKDTRARLGLVDIDPNRKTFSLIELQGGIAATADQVEGLMRLNQENQADLTAQQKSLLHVHENVLRLNEAMRSLSLVLALDIEIPQQYRGAEDRPATALMLEQNRAAIKSDLRKLIRRKGENPARYNNRERALADLGFALNALHDGGALSQDFRVIPASPHWIAPWAALKDTAQHETLKLWQDAARAYAAGDAALWRETTQKIAATGGEHAHSWIIALELAYHDYKPLRLALYLYIAAAALIMLRRKFAQIPLALPYAALTAGMTLHLSGAIARIVILGRPPVGTLYESVLFVAMIVAASGFFLRKKETLAPLAGALTAALLLWAAPVFATRGETLEVLVAVLNTNFWLTVHVLCITAGYGFCLLAAALAHFWLGRRAFGGQQTESAALNRSIHLTSLIALFLTATGTALGGIWADQSWGRFWGWDPKENGALLIVLWLAWLQHGRMSGWIKPVPFAAGMAMTALIVALAWFGVNLLGVGLHSYGFTSGMASGLAIYAALQIAIIFGLWLAAHLKGKRHEIKSA